MRNIRRFLVIILVVGAAISAIWSVYYFVYGKASHLNNDLAENNQHQSPAQSLSQPNHSDLPQTQQPGPSRQCKNIVERVVDGITYELIFDCQLRDRDVAGSLLPYFYMTGRYRKKTNDNTASWQKFLLYLRGGNTKYESIEIVLQDWRITDGITQWPNHDLPDGVPDSIEYIGDLAVRFCIYHQYVWPGSAWHLRDINNDGVSEWFEGPRLPFRPDEHQPWLAIPEIGPEHLGRAVALAQKKLRLVTELVNIKELKQCISKIERERIEQILR